VEVGGQAKEDVGVSDEPTAPIGTSVEDEPLAAFTDDAAAGPNRGLRIVVVVVIVVLAAAAISWWWGTRPSDPQKAAQEAAAACDTFDAAKPSGTTIADFDAALTQSRAAVKLDPIWSDLDRSLFSAIDALVYLKKVPARPTRTQEYAARTMSVQYYQATQALADQCALAKSRS
jgi:hypothetical protein